MPFLAMFHNPFCAMKPPSSNCSLNLSLSVPSFTIPVQDLSLFKLENSFQHYLLLFRVLLFWSTAVHQFRPQTAPSITRAPHQSLAIRAHSSFQVVLFQVRCSSSFQLAVESIFPSTSGPHTFPGILILLLLLPHLTQRNLLVANHRSARCFSASLFLVHKSSLFYRLWFRFFTIVPLLLQKVKASYSLQGRVHLLPSLLNCAGSDLRHVSSLHCLP